MKTVTIAVKQKYHGKTYFPGTCVVEDDIATALDTQGGSDVTIVGTWTAPAGSEDEVQGALDCSSNPNYPAASKGDLYVVSVAGKIGGASCAVVSAGDTIRCLEDTVTGNHATVGTKWNVGQGSLNVVNGPGTTVVTGAAALFDGTTGNLLKQVTPVVVADITLAAVTATDGTTPGAAALKADVDTRFASIQTKINAIIDALEAMKASTQA